MMHVSLFVMSMPSSNYIFRGQEIRGWNCSQNEIVTDSEHFPSPTPHITPYLPGPLQSICSHSMFLDAFDRV